MGSEMCIRDRIPKLAIPPLQLDAEGVTVPRGAGNRVMPTLTKATYIMTKTLCRRAPSPVLQQHHCAYRCYDAEAGRAFHEDLRL